MLAPVSDAPPQEALEVTVAGMREAVSLGHTRPLRWRRERLDTLERLLDEHVDEVIEALAADLGKPPVEATHEIVAVRQELRLARKRLRRWMRPRRVGLPGWALPGTAAIHREPLGCVLIIGPWNYPFSLTLQPLVSALAAGNTAILKPSEHAPRTAALIARLVRSHFSAEVVQVVLGDGTIAARLLEESFDHVFFTGGGRVGRLVLAAAARHLTPVTLELGGKSPAIVLADADLATSARRIVWGKSMNAGQTCIAPDYLLVAKAVKEPLLRAMAEELRRFYGANPLESPDLGRIVNTAQYERLHALLEGARQRDRIVIGGGCDGQARRIEPTLVRVDDLENDPLMQEEIFGPLLPVIAVDDLEQALATVRRRPKPLALYLFGGSADDRARTLASTSSGGVAFNEVILQAGVATLPFGGVGESGMGNYHGEAGFRTFSHERTVLSRPFWLDLPFRYPPYAGKLPLLQKLMG